MRTTAVLDADERAVRRATHAARLRRATPHLLMLAPIVLLLALVVYPMVYNVNLSLRSYRTGEFVGLHNFLRVFDDALFIESIKATAVYIVLAVSIEVLLGLGLALFIHRTVTSGLLRSLFYVLMILPMVTPPVAAGVIARLMYTPNYGVINYLLRGAGIIQRDIEWLSTGPTAMFSVLSVDIWQWTPFVFLVLTGGGPGSTTEFLSVYLYRVAFKFFNLSYAAAISFYVLIIASVVFMLLQRLLVTEAVMGGQAASSPTSCSRSSWWCTCSRSTGWWPRP